MNILAKIGIKGIGAFNLYMAFATLIALIGKLFLPRPSWLLPFGVPAAAVAELSISLLAIWSGIALIKTNRLRAYLLVNIFCIAAILYFIATLYASSHRAWSFMSTTMSIWAFAPPILLCATELVLCNGRLRESFHPPESSSA